MNRATTGPLVRLVQAARDRKLFQRDRFPLELKAEACLLYHRGLSLRKVAAHFGHKFCAETVRNWMRRLSLLFNYLGDQHDIIVVDETTLHRGRRNVEKVTAYRTKGRGRTWRAKMTVVRHAPPTHVLWVGIDARTLHVVGLRLGRVQTAEDCYEFLAEVRHRSRTDPFIVHDRGMWYRKQPNLLGLRHEQVRGGIRSRIECWNRQLKHRLDGFWRCWTPNTTPESMEIWLRSYAVLWNLTHPERA